MFLQHVRTRLDRQRNYFRIYMISHALISDSVMPSYGASLTEGRQLADNVSYLLSYRTERDKIRVLKREQPEESI